MSRERSLWQAHSFSLMFELEGTPTSSLKGAVAAVSAVDACFPSGVDRSFCVVCFGGDSCLRTARIHTSKRKDVK